MCNLHADHADRLALADLGHRRVAERRHVDDRDRAGADDLDRVVGIDERGGVLVEPEPDRERVVRERAEQAAEPIALAEVLIDDHAVGQVREAGEQMQIDDFGLGEIFFQRDEVGVVYFPRSSSEFFDVGEGSAFFFVVAGIISGFERGPVVGGEADALRRGDVMLGAIVASVDQRNADVDEFIEFAVRERPTLA